MFEEADHNIWVYECCVFSYEGLGDISHDAGVVAGKAFSSIHLHTETSPWSFRRKPLWNQQVPEDDNKPYNYIKFAKNYEQQVAG